VTFLKFTIICFLFALFGCFVLFLLFTLFRCTDLNSIICSLGYILFAPVSDPLKNNKGENVALKHVGHNLNPFPVALVYFNVAAEAVLVVQMPRLVLFGVPWDIWYLSGSVEVVSDFDEVCDVYENDFGKLDLQTLLVGATE